MWKVTRRFYQSMQFTMREWRFRRLTRNLPYQPVVLEEEEKVSTRRQFISHIMSGVLAMLAVLPIAGQARAERLRRWAEEFTHGGGATSLDPTSQRRRYMIAGHTNVPATNVHTNSASKHVNVRSEVGHFNQTRPHMNSHFNSPHGNQTLPDKKPEPEKDKTGKEKA